MKRAVSEFIVQGLVFSLMVFNSSISELDGDKIYTRKLSGDKKIGWYRLVSYALNC